MFNCNSMLDNNELLAVVDAAPVATCLLRLIANDGNLLNDVCRLSLLFIAAVLFNEFTSAIVLNVIVDCNRSSR